jgi:hypothetical protein
VSLGDQGLTSHNNVVAGSVRFAHSTQTGAVDAKADDRVGELEQSMAEERFCRAGFGNL